jgi:thiamine biosynthesis lipoprotein
VNSRTGRTERIADQIYRELSEIFAGDLTDPKFEVVTVTRVDLSRDLGQARVHFVASSEDTPIVVLESALNRASDFFRATLSERLPRRRTPQLQFRFDRGTENVDRINTLLDRISKRRKTLSWLLGAIFGLRGLFSVAVAEKLPDLERYEASFSAMGTQFTVAAYGKKRGFVASAVASAFEEVRNADLMLNHYQPGSELSLINRNAANGPWKITESMGDLLEKCLNYSRLSEGGFDITVGPLMHIWGFPRNLGRVPSASEITRALSVVSYRFVELDRLRGTVRFLRKGVELDPGAMGKGYAVDRMVSVLREAGLKRFFISGGSSSLYAGHAPPSDKRGWRVSIRSQKEGAKPVKELYLMQESLSTSGSYEKFFEIDDKRYSHLMSPHTGNPVMGMLSVSVTAPTSLASEIWATALFVNGVEWTRQHKPEGLQVLACTIDQPCEWIH